MHPKRPKDHEYAQAGEEYSQLLQLFTRFATELSKQVADIKTMEIESPNRNVFRVFFKDVPYELVLTDCTTESTHPGEIKSYLLDPNDPQKRTLRQELNFDLRGTVVVVLLNTSNIIGSIPADSKYVLFQLLLEPQVLRV